MSIKNNDVLVLTGRD